MDPPRESFVSRYLIIPKSLYVTMNFAFYSCYTFRSKFFKEVLAIKISGYGYVAGILALVTFFTSFFWSGLADRLSAHKLILLWTSVLAAAAFELFQIRFSDHDGQQVFVYVMSGLYMFFCSAMAPILDKIVLETLSKQSSDAKQLYGRQRLWGTAAYGVVTIVTSQLIEKLGYESMFVQLAVFTAIFVVYGFFILPADSLRKNAKDMELANSKAIKLQEQPEIKPAAEAQESEKKKSRKPMVEMLMNPEYLFFLLVVFMNGFARAIMTFFLSYYLLYSMKLSETQVAISAVFGILLEIGLFFISKPLLNRFGVYWMLIGAQFSMVLRMWAYYIIPSTDDMVYLVYFVELLKGVNFGLMHSAGVQLAYRVAPKGLEASAQGLYAGTFTGLSASAAGIVGGFIYNEKDPKPIFMYSAVISTVAFFLFLIKYGIFDRSINLEPFKIRRHNAEKS